MSAHRLRRLQVLVVGVVPMLWVFAVLGSVRAEPPGGNAHSGATATPGGATTLRLRVPALFKDEYWVYVDGVLVGSPPYAGSEQWEAYRYPFETFTRVYGDQGEVVAAIDDGTVQIRELNPAHLRQHHFYTTIDVPARPGLHRVEVLIGAGCGSDLVTVAASDIRDTAFPFFIGGNDVDVRQGQITVHVAPAVTEAGSAIAWSASPVIEYEGSDAPQDAELGRPLRWYQAMPVVRAFHGAQPPYRSTTGKVVRLPLPASLGGTREFDEKQIQKIVDILRSLVEDEFNRNDSVQTLESCPGKYPKTYAAYRTMRDYMNDELTRFARLLGNAHGAQ